MNNEIKQIREFQKGSPAREAHRGNSWSHPIGNTNEMERKSGARSAPEEIPVSIHWEYEGNSKEIRRAKRAGECLGVNSSEIQMY